MTWTCHLPTLHHTSAHMLGTHAGFPVIPTLRRSFTSEILDWGDQQVYPYSFLRTRVDQWTLVSICACLAYMYMEKQGWTHFTLFISFLLCCFKLCNHLHTINGDIWLLSTTTTSFLYWLISALLLLKKFTLEQTFLLLLASRAREVDDPC